jgi:uncharacterized membrane-anchored protein YhcB (DUF1043 family)
MIHFFRKIRQQLFTNNKFSKYLLYAMGEIVLVVIGILIALQINTWNNQKLLNKAEVKSYQNIKRQIIEDKTELTQVKGFNNYFKKSSELANKIIEAQDYNKADSLALMAMGLSLYTDFHSSGHIYETLVNSGDIKLLKNSEIPSKLQKLEMTYINVNNLEDIHWEIIINELSPLLRGVINYNTKKPVQPKKLYEVEMQNYFIESIYLTIRKDSIYTKALREIDTIITMIDNELNLNSE